MNYRGALLYLSTCWLSLAIATCAAAPGGQMRKTWLPVEVLMSGNQCLPAPETWTATWITSSDQLRHMVSRCRANRIGFSSDQTPSVDFERFGVLAVEMGRQSSAGYGFNTEKVNAYVDNRILTIEMEYNWPAPGAVTAQMVTGPWILIRLPAGPYKNILVTDPDGRVLTRLDLKE